MRGVSAARMGWHWQVGRPGSETQRCKLVLTDAQQSVPESVVSSLAGPLMGQVFVSLTALPGRRRLLR